MLNVYPQRATNPDDMDIEPNMDIGCGTDIVFLYQGISVRCGAEHHFVGGRHGDFSGPGDRAASKGDTEMTNEIAQQKIGRPLILEWQ